MGFWVHIKFQRVQAFLFAVPRLRVMLGANAALGEVLRIALPKCVLALREEGWKVPELTLPTAIDTDPLSDEESILTKDCPASLWQNYGIISRDGGHFEAWFDSKEQAEAFCKKARELLAKQLPGLRYQIQIKTESEPEQNELPTPQVAATASLPVFQVCQLSGIQAANHAEPAREDKKDKTEYRSDSVQQLLKKGKEFSERKTQDIIGLLSKDLPPADKEPPNDFNELCDKDYLAVIHADGNGVGDLFKVFLKGGNNPKTDPERFFHSLRVANRRAVKAALKDIFKDKKDVESNVYPYQLLMLGGDDLLLVCQAQYALSFVYRYAQHLAGEQPDCLPEGKKLSFAAGVAIARASVPFHHLQKMTEELCTSAKRLARGLDGNVSTVDWMVHSFSWSNDLISERTPNGHPNSFKPYRILAETATDGTSLETLLEWADTIKTDKAARSQLLRLRDELPIGDSLVELTLKELPDNLQETLKKNRKADNDSQHQQMLQLLDAIEIYEIQSRAGE